MIAIEKSRRRAVAAFLALAFALSLAPAPAQSADADVVAVKVQRAASGAFDFDVTVRSDDTGWDQYADALEVLTPDGRTVLKRRILLHPHDDEQPFTRDVYGVVVPPGTATVQVRARMKPGGYSGASMTVELPRN